MRDTFAQTIFEEAKKDKNIILMTGDLGFGVLDKFQQELPKQFVNSGVNEQALMGMAAGIASTGKRVFVYSIGNFPTLRCLEQIRNDVCLMNNSVVVVSVGAGYSYGPQGYTHHALEDIAVMRALPNMQVIVPADSIETQALTQLLVKSKLPSYLRLGRSNEKNIHLKDIDIKSGRFIEIEKGEFGTLIFSGSIGDVALEAAANLKHMGYPVSVASCPFISNLDREYLVVAAAKGPIITIEEHSSRGGLGSAMLEFLSFAKITSCLAIIAAEQKNPSQVGSQDFLRKSNGLSPERITEKFTALLEA
jgi:transketolase